MIHLIYFIFLFSTRVSKIQKRKFQVHTLLHYLCVCPRGIYWFRKVRFIDRTCKQNQLAFHSLTLFLYSNPICTVINWRKYKMIIIKIITTKTTTINQVTFTFDYTWIEWYLYGNVDPCLFVYQQSPNLNQLNTTIEKKKQIQFHFRCAFKCFVWWNIFNKSF